MVLAVPANTIRSKKYNSDLNLRKTGDKFVYFVDDITINLETQEISKSY